MAARELEVEMQRDARAARKNPAAAADRVGRFQRGRFRRRQQSDDAVFRPVQRPIGFRRDRLLERAQNLGIGNLALTRNRRAQADQALGERDCGC